MSTTALFALGQTVATRAAIDLLNADDVSAALSRHVKGDWGELGLDDWKSNETALTQGLRLFSAYVDRGGHRFWIITEADRSVTTVLLPDDY